MANRYRRKFLQVHLVNSNAGQSTTPPSIFDRAPQIIAAASFIALAITVTHEAAYFSIVGLEFLGFLSTTDYATQFVVWFMPGFVTIIVFVGIQALLERSTNFEKPQTKTKFGGFLSNYRLELIYFFLCAVAFFMSNETKLNALYALIGLLWIRASLYFFDHNDLKKLMPKGISVLVAFVPGTMIFFYGAGRDAAYRDLNQNAAESSIRLKSELVSHPVNVLRVLDRGLIIYEVPSRLVRFVPKDRISSVERNAPQWDKRSFSCRAVGWPCPAIPAAN